MDLHENNLLMASDFSQLVDFDVQLCLPKGLKLHGDKVKLFLKIHIQRQ